MCLAAPVHRTARFIPAQTIMPSVATTVEDRGNGERGGGCTVRMVTPEFYSTVDA